MDHEAHASETSIVPRVEVHVHIVATTWHMESHEHNRELYIICYFFWCMLTLKLSGESINANNCTEPMHLFCEGSVYLCTLSYLLAIFTL